MQRQRQFFGKDLPINQHLLEMLCIWILMVQNTVASSCGAHVCLNWKIQDTRLVLVCKVDAFNFPITFFDPSKSETGFCVPQGPCISLLQKAEITKNNTLHAIIFTIPLQMQLNGVWTCKYGDSNEKADTEVTLQNDQLKTGNEIPNNIECWILIMVWCMFGFTCSFLPLRLFILVYKCLGEEKKNKPGKSPNSGQGDEQNKNCGETTNNVLGDEQNKNSGKTTNNVPGDIENNNRRKPEIDSRRVIKIIIVFSLSISLVVLPIIVGHVEGKKCTVFKEFAIYGAIVGVVICVLLINKEAPANTNNGSGTSGDALSSKLNCFKCCIDRKVYLEVNDDILRVFRDTMTSNKELLEKLVDSKK